MSEEYVKEKYQVKAVKTSDPMSEIQDVAIYSDKGIPFIADKEGTPTLVLVLPQWNVEEQKWEMVIQEVQQ